MPLLFILFLILMLLAWGFVAQPFFATPTGYGPIRRFKGFIPIAVVMLILAAFCYHTWGNYTQSLRWENKGEKQYKLMVQETEKAISP